MIHETDGRYVIASGGVWLPGSYESRRAANYAFRFSWAELVELNAINQAEGRPITFEDLQSYRREHPLTRSS